MSGQYKDVVFAGKMIREKLYVFAGCSFNAIDGPELTGGTDPSDLDDVLNELKKIQAALAQTAKAIAAAIEQKQPGVRTPPMNVAEWDAKFK